VTTDENRVLWSLERDQVMIQVGKWSGIEKFEGTACERKTERERERERESFMFNTFIYFKPVK